LNLAFSVNAHALPTDREHPGMPGLLLHAGNTDSNHAAINRTSKEQ